MNKHRKALIDIADLSESLEYARMKFKAAHYKAECELSNSYIEHQAAYFTKRLKKQAKKIAKLKKKA